MNLVLGLAERKQLFEQLTESTSDVLWMFSHDWADLLFVNCASEEVGGRLIAALEADPTDFLNEILPADGDRVTEAMVQLSTGESVELEYWVDAETNYQRWVWVQGPPVADESEEVEIVAWMLRNETVLTGQIAVVRVNVTNGDSARGCLSLTLTANGEFETRWGCLRIPEAAALSCLPSTVRKLSCYRSLLSGGSITQIWAIFE